jgi:predicted nucleotidyltransferase
MQEDRADRVEEAVTQVLAHLLSTEDDLQAVMLRGSQVTGLTTPTSDVDMYIVTNVRGPETFHYDHEGLDFHIRRYPEKYLAYEIAEHNLRYIGFFRHAKVLYDPDGAFDRLQQLVDSIPATDLAATWIREARHQAKDARGQIEKGDFQTALYILRFGGHFLSWASLLPTPQATYKGKDVITRLRESRELEPYRDSLFQIMDLDQVSEEHVREKQALLASTIDAIEEFMSTLK